MALPAPVLDVVSAQLGETAATPFLPLPKPSESASAPPRDSRPALRLGCCLPVCWSTLLRFVLRSSTAFHKPWQLQPSLLVLRGESLTFQTSLGRLPPFAPLKSGSAHSSTRIRAKLTGPLDDVGGVPAGLPWMRQDEERDKLRRAASPIASRFLAFCNRLNVDHCGLFVACCDVSRLRRCFAVHKAPRR